MLQSLKHIAIISLFALAACSPQERLTHLLKHNPELKKDSTKVYVKHDTIITKGIYRDSVINNIFSRDTIRIQDHQLTIKYIYKGNNQAGIQGIVTADTITRTDTVRVVHTMTVQAEKLTLWQKIKNSCVLILLGFFVCFAFLMLLNKVKPKA